MRPALWTVLVVATLIGAASRLDAAGPPTGPFPALARGQFLPQFGQRRDPPREQKAPPRHYADVPFEGDMEMSLKAWLSSIRGLRDLIEQLQKNPELFDPKKIAKGDWNDPKFLEKEGPKLLEMFKKMGLVEQQGEGVKLNAAKIKGLKDLEKKFGKWKNNGGPDPNPDEILPDPDGPPPFQGKTLPPRPPPPQTPEAVDGDGQDKLAEFFKNWMLKMEDSQLGDLFKNSPAFQEGIKDLTESIRKGEALMWKPGAGFLDNVTKFANPSDLKWLTNSFSNMGNLSMPSLRPPRFGGPKFGGWAASIPAPAPVFGSGPAIGGAGFGMVVLWVGVGVVVLLLVWKILPQLKLAARERAQAGWQLGPWPVDPHRVATRAEVVQAFEFLSLLRFGLDVRTWNHRDIAVALGGKGGNRHAAEELAQVYEWARYTPDDERLPEASLAAARRDLCFLAGMS